MYIDGREGGRAGSPCLCPSAYDFTLLPALLLHRLSLGALSISVAARGVSVSAHRGARGGLWREAPSEGE